MRKNYLQWHILKSNIEKDVKTFQFTEREIWWCAIGVNLGVETDGKNYLFERPIIVIRKFNKEMLWAIPLTSQHKTGDFYYTFNYNNKREIAMLSQVRVISSKRLLRRMGKIDIYEYEKIKQYLKKLI